MVWAWKTMQKKNQSVFDDRSSYIKNYIIKP